MTDAVEAGLPRRMKAALLFGPRDLRVVEVDAERNLLLIRGAVPGADGGQVIVRPSVKAARATPTAHAARPPRAKPTRALAQRLAPRHTRHAWGPISPELSPSPAQKSAGARPA